MGVCCIALAIYGMGILPVNLFGLVFMVVAFVLFILDIKAPTHGALTAAGTVSFIVGALILFNSIRLPGYPTVSIPLVISTGVLLGAFFFGLVSIGILAQKKPVIAGTEVMVGKIGYAVSESIRKVKFRLPVNGGVPSWIHTVLPSLAAAGSLSPE